MGRTDFGPFGVIGEDETDCATVRVLIRRLVGDRTRVERRYGGGCAEVFRKASAWMHELARAGCARVVLLHDLDRDPRNGQLKDEPELRRRLEAIAYPRSIERLICIPIEELEAWLWSDPQTLKRIARGDIDRRNTDAAANPHLIAKPKEKLVALSRGGSGAARYSTFDNRELAETLDLALCASRCTAFRTLTQFVGAPL